MTDSKSPPTAPEVAKVASAPAGPHVHVYGWQGDCTVDCPGESHPAPAGPAAEGLTPYRADRFYREPPSGPATTGEPAALEWGPAASGEGRSVETGPIGLMAFAGDTSYVSIYVRAATLDEATAEAERIYRAAFAPGPRLSQAEAQALELVINLARRLVADPAIIAELARAIVTLATLLEGGKP